MKFMGIDSAALSGWAFEDATNPTSERSWLFGTVRADSAQKYDVLALAKEHGVTHAIIEKPRPFLANGGKGQTTMATFGSMCESYGRWVEACDRMGIEVVPCFVASWQAAMLVINGKKIQQKQAGDDKAGSKLVAAYHGAKGCNGDEADAVCLCLYGPAARTRKEIEEQAKREARAAQQKVYRERRKAVKA